MAQSILKKDQFGFQIMHYQQNLKRDFILIFFINYSKKIELNQFAEGYSHLLVTQSLIHSIDLLKTDDHKEQESSLQALP